jgi:hypothetical protein
MHGGMESFILDIAFKITLSIFAKLPVKDWQILIYYFPNTMLITHLDSVKENIQEKIMITKVNGLSRIECFFLR